MHKPLNRQIRLVGILTKNYNRCYPKKLSKDKIINKENDTEVVTIKYCDKLEVLLSTEHTNKMIFAKARNGNEVKKIGSYYRLQ